jgi:DNA-binding transcriptional regulator YiaG
MDEAIAAYGHASTPVSDAASGELLSNRAPEARAVTVTDEGDAIRQRALDAIGELRGVLLASESGVAEIAGIDRNTVRTWRKGERDPYPATVRPLFELQSLVRIVEALGYPGGARAWLSGTGPQGATRLDVLHRPGGVDVLAAELRPEFFTTALPSTLPTGDELDAAGSAEDYQVEHAPGSFSQPVVRTRTVP